MTKVTSYILFLYKSLGKKSQNLWYKIFQILLKFQVLNL